MAGRRCEVTDVREVLRRLHLGEPDRRIARELGLSRNTVASYRRWAERHELLSGPLPDAATLAAWLRPPERARPAHEQSCVVPFREQVVAWRQQGVEGQAIFQLLVEQHGFAGSYSAVKRFLRRLEPATPRATVRLETPPGHEAQVDFGPAGLLFDPEAGRCRKAWAFVMTLSFSRHQYVEFVFDQTVATWCRCHRAAFEWFQGVPRRLVIDNLKAAIVHAVWHEPEVQRVYAELAEHYGCLIAPCRPRTPEHKLQASYCNSSRICDTVCGTGYCRRSRKRLPGWARGSGPVGGAKSQSPLSSAGTARSTPSRAKRLAVV